MQQKRRTEGHLLGENSTPLSANMDKASTTERRKTKTKTKTKTKSGCVYLERRPTATQKCGFLYIIYLNQDPIQAKGVVSLYNLTEPRPTQKCGFLYLIFLNKGRRQQ
jgi:hypothetical protein